MDKTFELTIRAVSLKSTNLKYQITNKLHSIGVTTFIEDIADDLEKKTNEECSDIFSNLEKEQGSFGSMILHSYDKEYLEGIQKKIEEEFSRAITTSLSWVTSDSWKNSWKDHFTPLSIGSFLICPPWKIEQEKNKKTIIIEPAMSFGTGQHETTQLCLEMLSSYAKKNTQLAKQNLLDIGTGSGILAIAAKKIGFGGSYGLDIDQDAVQSAKTNCQKNMCSVTTIKQTLSAFLAQNDTTKFDLVIANILLSTIADLMEDIAKATKKNGHIILSGLLTEQKDPILAIGENFGFALKEYKVENDWCCLLMQLNKEHSRA